MAIPMPSFFTSTRTARIGRRSDVASGAYLRGEFFGHDVNRYRLVYRPGQLNSTSLAALLSEYSSTGGGATTTTFTPSGGSPVTVRFVAGSLRYETQSVESFSAQVDLDQEVW